MKTGFPSVPSSRRRSLSRARKLTVDKFAEWQNRPVPQPSRPLVRLVRMLARVCSAQPPRMA